MNEAEPTNGCRDRGRAVRAITWGIAVTLAGVALILWTTGVLRMGNWWAVFILIPAAGSFADAVLRFRCAGNRFTKRVAGAISGGLFLTAVGLLFLFDLDWGVWWGVFIVLAGVSILLGAFGRRGRTG